MTKALILRFISSSTWLRQTSFSKIFGFTITYFPQHLKGPALEWYYSLHANSIDSFEMLCARFIAKFADNKSTTTSSASLQHVTQGDSEPLRPYMTWFTKATLAIPDLHLVVAMHALLVGLKPSPFLDTLYANPPLNMDNLRARAARYMSWGECEGQEEEVLAPYCRRKLSVPKKGQAEKVWPLHYFQCHHENHISRGLQLEAHSTPSPDTITSWCGPVA